MVTKAHLKFGMKKDGLASAVVMNQVADAGVCGTAAGVVDHLIAEHLHFLMVVGAATVMTLRLMPGVVMVWRPGPLLPAATTTISRRPRPR